jgi:hypothetical protein
MTDEPTAGAEDARTDREAPPQQESDDTPDRITIRDAGALFERIENRVEAGEYQNRSAAVRDAIRRTFPATEGSA